MPHKDLLSRYFDPSGLLVGAPLQTLPSLLAAIENLPARERPFVNVTEAVREHLALLQDREEIQQQKEWFLDQVKRGRRTFDVLSTKLYPYQEQGAMHLAFGRRAMLADDMGLGKTVQAIAAAALLKEMRDIQKAVVICPASLKHQWAREIRRFTSLSVTVVEGNLEERRSLYSDPSFFKIINYELVRFDMDELLKLHPDLIILDEAQRIKNWRAKTAMMVKSLPSRYAFVLTGTPLENRIDELYSIFQFLDPRILGPLWHFNDRFYELEKRESGTYKVLGYKNIDQLRALIKPYILRRTRDEVLKDLPARTDNNFFVEMTDLQWDAYNEFKEKLAKLISASKRRPLTPKERELLLMYMIKMRLICNALALHDKEIELKDSEKTAPKLGELDEILTEEIASNGHKAVIFSQWATMLALTEPVLKRIGLGYVKLTGDVPSAKRGDLIQKFFDDPECRFFLSTDAGAVQLMTVHKAKGLEFPLTVLADAAHQTHAHSAHVQIMKSRSEAEWTNYQPPFTNLLLDLRDNDFHSTAWQLAARLEDDRAEAEDTRLLYVAATRAKEKLLVSGHVKQKKDGMFSLSGWLSKFSFLEMATPENFPINDGIYAAVYPYSQTDEPRFAAPQPDSTPQTESPRKSNLLELLIPNIPLNDEKTRARESEPPQRVWRIVSNASRKTPRAPTWLVGRLVHEAIHHWRFDDLDNFLKPFALESGLTDEAEIHAAIQEASHLLERLRAPPLFSELNSAERHHEVRYDLPDGRGIIDLLYRTNAGWFIIDFKTDDVRSDAAAQSAISQNGYDRQVERYAQAISNQLKVEAKTRIVFLNGEVKIYNMDF